MSRPSVVILCPREFKFTDHEASVERPFLNEVADVRTVWLDYNASLPNEVLESHVLILWHGPMVSADVIAQMRNCRAIIRNGVGFDSVDIGAQEPFIVCLPTVSRIHTRVCLPRLSHSIQAISLNYRIR